MYRLSALPPELLSYIVSELIDPQDNSALFDLRLTCKQLHDSCDAAFLNAHFGERWHLYTEYSLKALCGISKNVRLRKRLTWLRLSFPEADHMHLDRHVERCHSVPIGSKSKRRLVKKCDDDCLLNNSQEDQEAILELCSELLEAALENFALAGITPNLAICGFDTRAAPYNIPFGVSAMRRQLVRLDIALREGRMRMLGGEVHLTLQAIARSRCPVVDLNLGGTPEDQLSNSTAFEITLAPWNAPWANLARLRVVLGLSNINPDFHNGQSPFHIWLSPLHALQESNVAFEWPEYRHLRIYNGSVNDWTRSLGKAALGRLAKCLDNAPLTSLTIGEGRFGKEGILHFLSFFQTRLRSLRLNSTSIIHHNNSACFETLDWIANNLQLVSIDVEDLPSVNPEKMHTEAREVVDLDPCRRELTTADGDFDFYIGGTPDRVKAAFLEQFDLLDFEEDVGSELSDDSMESDWDVHSWDALLEQDDVEPDREAELLAPL